ncbi:hypothetical protein HMPREF1148_1400 [Selenomonas sp. FOBRC6]|nr:hypothetical protein HMPREF1148_1400 [Selenomonas sp. FOBRC6]
MHYDNIKKNKPQDLTNTGITICVNNLKRIIDHFEICLFGKLHRNIATLFSYEKSRAIMIHMRIWKTLISGKMVR